jgi:hypothetical protein
MCNEYLLEQNEIQFMYFNSMAFRPQANYTDWATTTGQRILVPAFVDRGVSRGQRGGTPAAINLSFLDQNHYSFFQVAPHLCSGGLMDPHSRPIATQKIW